jgi:hypothetical protein
VDELSPSRTGLCMVLVRRLGHLRHIGVLAVTLLLTTSAVADNPANWLPDWRRPQKPLASPTVPAPVPAPHVRAKPEVAPAKPVESAPAPPKAQPRSIDRAKPKRPKPKVEQAPISGGGQALPPKSVGITCAEARQGVGMPCVLIRANAYRYERLSPAEKARADACLTAAERAAIKACFR